MEYTLFQDFAGKIPRPAPPTGRTGHAQSGRSTEFTRQITNKFFQRWVYCPRNLTFCLLFVNSLKLWVIIFLFMSHGFLFHVIFFLSFFFFFSRNENYLPFFCSKKVESTNYGDKYNEDRLTCVSNKMAVLFDFMYIYIHTNFLLHVHSKLQRFKNKSSKIVISDQSILRFKYKS